MRFFWKPRWAASAACSFALLLAVATAPLGCNQPRGEVPQTVEETETSPETETTAETETSEEPDADKEIDYTVLFDQDHTEGWQQAGPGGFDVADGVATPHGGMGLWWYSGQTYGDFVLSLEFNMETIDANSGVFLRFPDPGDDPWVAVHNGFEVQIAGDEPSAQTTGAIYDKQAATSVPLRSPGEWNEYEIKCQGNMVYVTLNGELVNEFEYDGEAEGYIGIQNHDDTSVVHYRNIRVEPIE